MIGRKRHPVPAPTPRRAPITHFRDVLFVDGPLAGKRATLKSAAISALDLLDPADVIPAELSMYDSFADYVFTSRPEERDLYFAALGRNWKPDVVRGWALAHHSPGTRPRPVLATVAKLTAWCATCDNMVHSARDGAVGGGVRTIETWTHDASNLDLMHQPLPAHPIIVTTHEVNAPAEEPTPEHPTRQTRQTPGTCDRCGERIYFSRFCAGWVHALAVPAGCVPRPKPKA